MQKIRSVKSTLLQNRTQPRRARQPAAQIELGNVIDENGCRDDEAVVGVHRMANGDNIDSTIIYE